LQSAPNVTLLVTSRERLSLAAEWLVAISGLPYPAQADVQDPTRFAAVQLFILRAQQVDAEFAATTDPQEAIRKICQLVEGMPLALELAATWLGVYSCEQIAGRIEADLGFLSTRLRNIPARHRSLQAVFDHSWELMNSAEQMLLQRLAIFKGGFSREAALQVAEATDGTLAALLDKSLLRPRVTEEGGNRYDIHEILRQFAAVRLAEAAGDEAATRDRHCRYYAHFCVEQERLLKSDRVAEAIEMTAADLDNLQTAWRWTFNRPGEPELRLLGEMLEGLLIFFEIRGRFQEGLALTEEATEAVFDYQSGAESVILGRLMSWQGWFNFRLANNEKGQALSEQGLAMIQAEGAWEFTAYPLLFRAAAAFGLGKLAKARELFQQSLDVYRKLDDAWGIGGNLSNLGHVATSEGDYETAESFLLESLAVTEANDILYLHSRGLQTLGRLYTLMGKVEPARRSMEQTLKVSQTIGDKYSEAMTLLDLGSLNEQLGEGEAVVSNLQRAQELFSEIGDRLNECWAIVGLANIAFSRERPNQAHQYWGAVLKKGQEIQSPAIMLAAAEGIARLHALNDNILLALALLIFIKNHALADHQTTQAAVEHFDELVKGVKEGKVKAAELLAAGWDLEGMVANLYRGT
jgi:predicted ATPase/Flp pilus assembly protein TadD